MKRSRNLDRRRFLQTAAAGAAGGAAACSGRGSPYRCLSEDEAALITAIANRIIPPDDYSGAGDAGAARFLDRYLLGPYANWREDYRAGLQEIGGAARERYGKAFVELSPAEQDALLEAREDSSFFRMIRDHTMQSYYGDPRHGGNPEAVSWQMLGVPHPPVRGREQYDLTSRESRASEEA